VQLFLNVDDIIFILKKPILEVTCLKKTQDSFDHKKLSPLCKKPSVDKHARGIVRPFHTTSE
jgi:hypothetical protein